MKKNILLAIFAAISLIGNAEDQSIYFSDDYGVCMYRFDGDEYLFQALDKNDRLGNDYFETDFSKNDIEAVLKQFKGINLLFNNMKINEQKVVYIVDRKFIMSKMKSQVQLVNVDDISHKTFYLNAHNLYMIIDTLSDELLNDYYEK